MVEKHTIPMQFHPRAFSAFGSDLVTNDYVAVNELIKNAYKIVRSGIINSKKLQDRLHRRRISGVN